MRTRCTGCGRVYVLDVAARDCPDCGRPWLWHGTAPQPAVPVQALTPDDETVIEKALANFDYSRGVLGL